MNDKREVVKIEVEYIGDDYARINMRLRGETKWLHFDGLYIREGDTLIVCDQEYDDAHPGGVKFYTKPIESEDER